MFLSWKKSIPVPVGHINQRLRLLHRRSRGSHNVVFITKKETDILGIDLEATALEAIISSLEVRVGGKPADLVTLTPIHKRLCWQLNQTMLHWVLYPPGKRRELWLIAPDVMSSILYVQIPPLVK